VRSDYLGARRQACMRPLGHLWITPAPVAYVSLPLRSKSAAGSLALIRTQASQAVQRQMWAIAE